VVVVGDQSWWVSMSRNLVSYVPMGDDRQRLATVSGPSSPDTRGCRVLQGLTVRNSLYKETADALEAHN